MLTSFFSSGLYSRRNPCTEGTRPAFICRLCNVKKDAIGAKLDLDLRFVAEASLENVMEPEVEFQLLDLEKKGHKGPGVFSDITLKEGQAVTFILREPPNVKLPSQAHPTHELAHQIGVPYESALSVMLVLVHSLIPIRRACGGGVQSAFSRRPNFDESKHCRYHPNTN